VLTTASVTIVAQASEGGNILAFLFPLLILGGLFYVLLILPQRRRAKRMQEMRSEIRGILGTVVDEDDDTFTLDIGGQTMRVLKRAIAERITEHADSDRTTDDEP
jgi:preprotein translocase YajC subunit